MGRLIALVIIVAILIIIGVTQGIKETEQARTDCQVIAGGHFVNQRGRECWSLDGTRRLFPSELF